MSTIAVKERGFNVTAAEARSLAAFRRTQFWRPVKHRLPTDEAVREKTGTNYGWMNCADHRQPQDFRVVGPVGVVRELCGLTVIRCPFGQPGEQLWVRECWTADHAAFYPNHPIVYRADFGPDYERNERGEVYSPESKRWYPFRWRPSGQMARSASRFTLEITGVRVRRLKSFGVDDCEATGMAVVGLGGIEEFRDLWRERHGKPSWDADPWCWVIDVMRIKNPNPY